MFLSTSFILLAGFLSTAGASAPLSPAQMQADFDLMRHALEEGHPGLNRYIPKPEMNRAFEAQRAKLTRPMTRPQFEAVVAQTLATMRCGHTKMNADEEVETAIKNARTFPLRVLTEGRRLAVVLNETPDNQTLRPGMEIVEINGQKAPDLIDRLWPFISGDGDIETGRLHDIAGRFAQLYWWLVEQRDNFIVKARDASGNTVVATLAGVTDAERRTSRNPVNETMKANIGRLMAWSPDDFALRFFNDSEVAEIRLRHFAGDTYRQWIEDTFNTLHEKGTKTLIIDLRGNGGGDDMYGAMLVSCLTDKPFRYFDRIELKTVDPSFKAHCDWPASAEARLREGTTPELSGGYRVTANLHPGVAEQNPGKHPFLGKVFVLTDGGTFSTAADFCAIVRHLNRATFIGKETGGAYCGNNSGFMPTLTLPNSQVGIRLPMYEYWNAVGASGENRRGTRPDHVIELKTADVLRGVDAQLDCALKLARATTLSQ